MATLDRLAPPTTASAGQAWKPRRAIAAVLMVAVAIVLLQVVQSSSFTNEGVQIQRLEAQKQDSTAQIHDMESQIAALSSLDRIERAARNQLGMVPAGKIDHVTVTTEAPSGPLLPRPILNPAPPAAPATEPWWQSLLKALPIHGN